MAITGITSTLERNQRIVTTAQNLTSASATSEAIVIDGSGTGAAIRASGSANIILQRCNIFVNATGGSSAQTNQSWLSYNGDSNSRTVTTRFLRLKESSVLVKSSGRVDFFLSELTNTNVSEVDNTRNLNVYTQPNAILNNARFTGINTWEVVGAPAQAVGLIFENVKAAMFNFEAGRLDFTRINVISFTVSSAFLSLGNGGNNSIYNWDVLSFDKTRLGREASNNLYFEGISASWLFKDRDTGANQSDVLVIYRDDRTTANTFAERGRYITNSNGRMVGTHDSRLGTTGASQERPTLFMLNLKLVDNASTGAYSSLSFSGGAGRKYDLVAITPRVEVRSYLHQKPSSYGVGENYPNTIPQGITNGDFSVNTYANFNLVVDSGITQTNKATVMAYTNIATLDQLYDRMKAEWRDNDNFPLFTFSGNELNLGSVNLVIDPSASSVYAYNSGTNTVTVKSSSLSIGTKFTNITTTGLVTANGTISNLTVNGNVSQATPTNLSDVIISGTLTYNTNSNVTITITNTSINTVVNNGTGIITINKVNSTITNYTDAEINFIDSTISVIGADTITFHPTASDRDQNINVSDTFTSSYAFKFGSTINGSTMSDILYLRCVSGGIPFDIDKSIVLGDNVVDLGITAQLTSLSAKIDLTAKEATLLQSETDIITEINANETKIDTIDTVVDSIKTKVDTLDNTDLTGIEADLIVINDGVKKASKLIPHNTNL